VAKDIDNAIKPINHFFFITNSPFLFDVFIIVTILVTVKYFVTKNVTI